MAQIPGMIFLVFWRFFAPICGMFSFLWAPFLFWGLYKRHGNVGIAMRGTARMLFGAWVIAPVMIAGFVCLGAALLPICLVPVLGWIIAAKALQSYANLFNRVCTSFYLPGRAKVRVTRPHLHPHHGDSSNSIFDDFRHGTDNAVESMEDYYSSDDSGTASTDGTCEQSAESVSTIEGDQATTVTYEETVSYEPPAQWADAMQGDQATSVSFYETAQGRHLSLEEIFRQERGSD